MSLIAFVKDGGYCLNFSSLRLLCSQLQSVCCSTRACYVLLMVDAVMNVICIVVLGYVCIISVPLASVPGRLHSRPEYHHAELLFHVVTGEIIFPSSTCKI